MASPSPSPSPELPSPSPSPSHQLASPSHQKTGLESDSSPSPSTTTLIQKLNKLELNIKKVQLEKRQIIFFQYSVIEVQFVIYDYTLYCVITVPVSTPSQYTSC